MHQFNTPHSEFDGFSEFFDRDVLPELHARDSVRVGAVRNGLIYALMVLIVLGAVGLGVLIRFDGFVFGVFILGVAVIGAYSAFRLATDNIRSETKGRIVTAIVGYVGWQFNSDVSSFDMTPYRGLFLLPKNIDRSSFEDSLSGQVHGASFRSVEAHLEKQTRDSDGDKKWSTVFRGQLMALDFPTKTFGRTIVLRDKGWFNPKKHDNMKRIGLVDPVFEKLFEAYGTDQVEGRIILDPAFMQKIVDLERAVSGKNIRFGFDRDRLYIAVETPNQFEAGSMFKSLTSPDPTQKILHEVGAVFDIVDTLLKRESRNALPY